MLREAKATHIGLHSMGKVTFTMNNQRRPCVADAINESVLFLRLHISHARWILRFFAF